MVSTDAEGSCLKGRSLSQRAPWKGTALPTSISGARLLLAASRGCIHFGFSPLMFHCGEAHLLYNPFPPMPCDFSQLGKSHISLLPTLAHTPYLLLALVPHYGNYYATASVAIQTLNIILALCSGKLHCLSETATVVVKVLFLFFFF